MVRDGDYILITTSVLRYPNLKGTSRELFCKIASLSLANGCIATNDYFSGLLGVSTKRIGNILSDLEKENLIERTTSNNRRVIRLTDLGVEVYGGSGGTKVPEGWNKSSKGGGTKVLPYNRIDNRNIIEREKEFEKCVSDLDGDELEKSDFFTYWSEPNKSGTKMKFEMQTTWDVSRRFKTWQKNSKTNFGRNKDNSNLLDDLEKKYG
jgi:hypothetical protein